jgi:exodeoxyribonuclease V beta subunit
MPVVNHNFNALTVSLSGSNLIEASAGTGKTYSIAIMALRLVVENDIPIQKILMVTFTKAAVAELELRVRAFIRLGLKVSRGGEINDTSITEIIQNAQETFSVEEVEKRLANAQLLLDETSVLTIHSFCQRTLSEYAFESGQMFHATTIEPSDFDQFVTDAFNQAWRNQITVLDERLLNVLLKN